MVAMLTLLVSHLVPLAGGGAHPLTAPPAVMLSASPSPENFRKPLAQRCLGSYAPAPPGVRGGHCAVFSARPLEVFQSPPPPCSGASWMPGPVLGIRDTAVTKQTKTPARRALPVWRDKTKKVNKEQ